MNGKAKKDEIATASVLLAVSVLIPFIALAAKKWVFSSGMIAFTVLFGALALASLGVLIAMLNRSIKLNDDGFAYRTWLGNECCYSYKEVIWYRETDYGLRLHMRDRSLIIDADIGISAEMVKKLNSLGIPDHDAEAAKGVFDDSGEQAQKVLYLEQRKGVTWIMLIYGAAALATGLFFLLYTDPSGYNMLLYPITSALWITGTVLFSGMFFYYALRAYNTKVELYRDHFIYCSAFGKRRSYSYRDCVSSRERRFYNRMPTNRKIRFVAKLKMNDGRKLYVDDSIIKDGLGAPLGYHKLPKK